MNVFKVLLFATVAFTCLIQYTLGTCYETLARDKNNYPHATLVDSWGNIGKRSEKFNLCLREYIELYWKPWDLKKFQRNVKDEPRAVSDMRTVQLWPGKFGRVNQWDVQHGNSQYTLCADEEVSKHVGINDLMRYVRLVPPEFRIGLEIVSEEGKQGICFRHDSGANGWSHGINLNFNTENPTQDYIKNQSPMHYIHPLLHEIGHALQGRWGGTQQKKFDELWRTVMKKDDVWFTGYASAYVFEKQRSEDPEAINNSEDLADFAQMYGIALHDDNIMNVLKDMNPNRLKLFKHILQNSQVCPHGFTGSTCQLKTPVQIEKEKEQEEAEKEKRQEEAEKEKRQEEAEKRFSPPRGPSSGTRSGTSRREQKQKRRKERPRSGTRRREQKQKRRKERPRSGTSRREQKQKRREERPRSGTSRREQKRKRKQKRKQRREEMQKRKRKGKVGQENNYASGIGKRIRGRNRNNFDEMENEFQLPTSYDNQDDENNFLDFLRERMLVEFENDIVTGREEENKNWRWDI
jgi:hypothetical protein